MPSAHKGCREGFSVDYLRLPGLFETLHLARGDGSYHMLMSGFAKIDLFVLDEWGLTKLNVEQRRDPLEPLDDHHTYHSTVVTSWIPVAHWHDVIADPNPAAAMLARLARIRHESSLINPTDAVLMGL